MASTEILCSIVFKQEFVNFPDILFISAWLVIFYLITCTVMFQAY